MKTIDPIRIHAMDGAAEARERHAGIERRLEELGRDRVSAMMRNGGFPTNYDPVVHAWLAGERLGDGKP